MLVETTLFFNSFFFIPAGVLFPESCHSFRVLFGFFSFFQEFGAFLECHISCVFIDKLDFYFSVTSFFFEDGFCSITIKKKSLNVVFLLVYSKRI